MDRAGKKGYDKLSSVGKLRAVGRRTANAIIDLRAETCSITTLSIGGKAANEKVTTIDAGEARKAIESRQARASGRDLQTAREAVDSSSAAKALVELNRESLRATDPTRLHGTLNVLISALKLSGGAAELPGLAQTLDNQGAYDLAAIVRQHIDPGKSLNEDPISLG